MKKSILTIVMTLFVITAFAQNEENNVRVPSGYQGFLEYGNGWHFNKTMPTSINLSTTHGFYYNGHIYVGVGFGFDFDKNICIVPFYANLRYVISNHTFASPVVSLRLGSYASDINIGAYGDLAFGVRFASKRDFAINVMVVGTYYDNVEYGHSVYDENGCYVDYVTEKINPSCISLRIGIEW